MTQSTSDKTTVPLITEELFREAYEFEEVRKPPLKKVLARNLKCSKNTFLNLFPIVKWLPEYKIKRDLLSDVIAGVTVAIMHIPHGLAYAPLGRVEHVVGFYMGVFPVFIYMFMGTSRHISIGTFAVVCAMVGQVVNKYEHPPVQPKPENMTNLTSQAVEYADNSTSQTDGNDVAAHNIYVGITICLLVGIWQTALGLLRLGSFTVIMSESMVSGYTCGAAVHVFTYQLKNLFGVNVATFNGVLKVFYIYIDFFSKIKTVNLITMSISASCIAILMFFNEFVKPRMQRKFPKNKIPIPIELIVIILGILVSYFGKLSKTCDVKIVGHIPTGFPKPLVPPVHLMPRLIFDTFLIAVVAVAINLSLAKIFAKKGDYEIANNQDILAYGIANIFGAFFRCIPSAASLSRSTIQFTVGGKTQLASLVSIILILFILLVAGSLFEPVPFCVLSSIVVVTLKGLLMQITELPKLWKRYYWDGIVWLGTFLGVIILGLDYGLAVGLLLSLIAISFRSYGLTVSVMGRVRNTNIFLDIDHYKSATTMPNILILQMIGDLNYTNSAKFENIILEKFKTFSESPPKEKSNIVLNMGLVTKVDPTAVNTLKQIYKYLSKSKCDLYLTDCNVNVYHTFEVCDLFKDLPKDQILASVADAVEYLNSLG